MNGGGVNVWREGRNCAKGARKAFGWGVKEKKDEGIKRPTASGVCSWDGK